MHNSKQQNSRSTKLVIPTLQLPSTATSSEEKDSKTQPSSKQRHKNIIRKQLNKKKTGLASSSSDSETSTDEHTKTMLTIPTLKVKNSDLFTSEDESSASSRTPTPPRRTSTEDDESNEDSYNSTNTQQDKSLSSSSSTSDSSSVIHKKKATMIPTLNMLNLFTTEEDVSTTPPTTPTPTRKLSTQQEHIDSSSSSTSSNTFSVNFSAQELLSKLSALKEFGDLKQSKFFDEMGGMVFYDTSAINYIKQHTIIDAPILHNLIQQYNASAQKKVGKKLSDHEFYIQKNIQATNACEYCVIGDIHGSLHSLIKILKDLIAHGYLNEKFKIIKPNFYMIFTGDYVDRGLYGTEVWYLLLNLVLANWDYVCLLRGNHESTDLTSRYGFDIELKTKYPDDFEQLMKDFKELYNYLPQALFTKDNNKWMAFFHGGLDIQFDIAKFLENKSHHISIYQVYDKDGRTGFMWYDHYGDSFSDRKKILPYIDSISAEFQKLNIMGASRGHQHYAAGLKVVNLDYDEGTDELIPATDKGPITISTITPPVFTFTTATEGGLSADLSSDVFYGIIKFNQQTNQWQIIPHLLERKK